MWFDKFGHNSRFRNAYRLLEIMKEANLDLILIFTMVTKFTEM